MSGLLVLSGFWPAAAHVVARTLLAEEPAMRLLSFDAAGPAQHGPGDDTAAPAVVVLPPWCEPDRLRTAWRAHAADHRGPALFVTVVAAEHLLDGLAHDDPLRSVGLHRDDADERSVGDLVARQVEQADCVVVVGAPEGDAWEAEQLSTLLQRLAPWASHLRLADERPAGTTLASILRRTRGTVEPVAPTERGLRGLLVGTDEPTALCGVSSVVFGSRRPLHPARLEAALDDLTDRVLRSRGHFWLASRPDLVMSWESTGTPIIGPVSGWLADLPDEHWSEVDALRRAAASLGWDPYYGDRHSRLVFIGLDLDAGRLHEVLHGCLLTDAELADGEEAWRRLPDPFARSYPASLGSGRPQR